MARLGSSRNITARQLGEPKSTNEPGRTTENHGNPARAEPKRAGSWLDPPLKRQLPSTATIISAVMTREVNVKGGNAGVVSTTPP